MFNDVLSHFQGLLVKTHLTLVMPGFYLVRSQQDLIDFGQVLKKPGLILWAQWISNGLTDAAKFETSN